MVDEQDLGAPSLGARDGLPGPIGLPSSRRSSVLRGAWRIAKRELAHACRRPAQPNSADRQLLEHVVLPHYAARVDVRSVLLVGTRWYTRHYPLLLSPAFVVTLDIAPGAARHGCRGAHLVCDVREVASLLAPASIDLVLFNGVFGWGLNDPAGMQQALSGMAEVLRPNGELVVGWNDIPRRCPFDWHSIPALQENFAALPFAPLGGLSRMDLATDNLHCFEFFTRVNPTPVRRERLLANETEDCSDMARSLIGPLG